MDEKGREIEKLQVLLGSAGEEVERVEGRIGTILGVTTSGLHALKDELNQIKAQVNLNLCNGIC